MSFAGPRTLSTHELVPALMLKLIVSLVIIAIGVYYFVDAGRTEASVWKFVDDTTIECLS